MWSQARSHLQSLAANLQPLAVVTGPQPLAATCSHSSGRKWPLPKGGRKWPLPSKWPLAPKSNSSHFATSLCLKMNLPGSGKIQFQEVSFLGGSSPSANQSIQVDFGKPHLTVVGRATEGSFFRQTWGVSSERWGLDRVFRLLLDFSIQAGGLAWSGVPDTA